MKYDFRQWLLLMVILMQSLAVQALDLDETERYLDDMLSYQLDFSQQKAKLTALTIDVEKELNKDIENPYLWYLKGRSSWAVIHVFDKKSPEYLKYDSLILGEYEKALSLNEKKLTLTYSQLRNMRGSASISIQATRQYIARAQKEGDIDPKEHLKLIRDQIIPRLISLNNFKDANKELDFIESNFPINNDPKRGTQAWRNFYLNEIEAQKAKLAAEQQAQEKVVVAATKPEPVASVVVAEPTPKTAAPIIEQTPIPKILPSAPPKTDGRINWPLGILVLLLIVSGAYLIRRNKK